MRPFPNLQNTLPIAVPVVRNAIGDSRRSLAAVSRQVDILHINAHNIADWKIGFWVEAREREKETAL